MGLAVDVMIVVGLDTGPDPMKVSDLPTFSVSVKVPAEIIMMSPSTDALMAAWMVV